MYQENNPFLTIGGILFILLGIVSFIFSFRVFGGNVYLSYGLIGIGIILLLVALVTRKRGAVGLVMAAAWLMLMGYLNLSGIRFEYDRYILGVIPIMAGILMAVGL